MELSYYASIDAAEPEIKKLREALKPLYGKQLTFGMGKAGRGYVSYHAVLNGITYGRVTFFNGQLYTVKHYKPFGYLFDVKDPGEFLFIRINAFYKTGEVLSYNALTKLIARACTLIAEQLTEARRYRESNPLLHRRKALKGRSLRTVITNMIRDCDFELQLVDAV